MFFIVSGVLLHMEVLDSRKLARGCGMNGLDWIG